MQHEAITNWAKRKFGLAADITVEIEQETVSGGYCDTCWYEYEVWVVYQIDAAGKRTKIHSFDDDFASILREVLDDAVANKE